jgi:hypothetical protein
MRRTIAVTAFALVGLGFGGVAAGVTGPSGSENNGGDITCGTERTILDSPATVYNGFAGTEVCKDGVGRVFLKSNWDKPNKGPIYLPDYVRLELENDEGDLHIEGPG